MNRKFALAASAMVGFFMLFSTAGYALAGGDVLAQGESCPVNWSMAGPAQYSGYIGTLVLDPQNHELGRVVHVTYGSDDTVRFLIISSCLPGMKDKLVAYPVKLFDAPEASRNTVVIKTTPEEFRGAPAIESRMYPSQVGSSWEDKSYHYFEKI